MLIARHAQVVGLPDIGTELERVIAVDVRPVVDELILVFVLIERAIAAIDAECRTGAEEVVTVSVDEERRHVGSEGIVVQAGDTQRLCRIGPQRVWSYEDFVAEVAEAEIGQQIGPHGIVEAGRDAVVARIRDAGERAGAAAGFKARPNGQTEGSGRGGFELRQAVAAEDVNLLVKVMIYPCIELIFIRLHAAGARVVGLVQSRGGIGQRNQGQQLLGLGR